MEQGKGLTSFIGGGGGSNPPTTGSSSPSSCESYPQLNGASNPISSIWRPQKPLGRPREGRRGPGMSRDVIFQITRLHPAGEPGGRLGRPPAPPSGSGGPKNGGSRGADGRPVRRGSGRVRQNKKSRVAPHQSMRHRFHPNKLQCGKFASINFFKIIVSRWKRRPA